MSVTVLSSLVAFSERFSIVLLDTFFETRSQQADFTHAEKLSLSGFVFAIAANNSCSKRMYFLREERL
jgi:hypothetical protein